MPTLLNVTKGLIEKLLNNELAAVVLPNFISNEDCEKAVKGIHETGIDYYENVFPKMGKIGITQFEHLRSPEKIKEYLKKSKACNSKKKRSF